MSPPLPDYQKHALLFIDDEPKTRKYFAKLFGKTFRVLLAADGAEGMARYHEHHHDIGVVITDERMPNETGREVLAKVGELNPSVVRILSTAYCESQGDDDDYFDPPTGIYCFISKPWDVPHLQYTLMRAMELSLVRHERDRLQDDGPAAAPRSPDATPPSADPPALDFLQRAVMLVSADAASRDSFAKTFADSFRVLVAEDEAAGIELLRDSRNGIGVVVADDSLRARPPEEFLAEVTALDPAVIPILAHSSPDFLPPPDGIFWRLNKPWWSRELKFTLKRAMEYHLTARERDHFSRP